MSNIDKQAVQAVADLKAGYILGHADVAILNELARIALASLEAEAVTCPKCNGTGMADSGGVQPWGEPINVPCDCTAPPAPVSAPYLLEQFAEFMAAESIKSGDYPDGWQCKASNAAHEYAQACRAAMLQGADGKADDGVFVSKSSEMSVSNITIDDSRCSNSTVIPDGWKLVPVELTGVMTNAMSDAILDDLHNVDVWRSVLAAAPQQEISHAIAKGMERYGDAMQELAKKEVK